jgi:hypothetical protein
MFNRLIAYFISCFYFLGAAAQQIAADSLHEQRTDAIAGYYHAFRAEYAFIYAGRAYADYGPLEGHAYAFSPGWQSGSVRYDDITYRNITLKYDLVQQLLVVQRPDRITQLSLQNRLVSGFSLGSRNFVQLQAVDNGGDSLHAFYEVLAEGSITLLAHRKKTIEDRIRSMRIERQVYEQTRYYALKGAVYYPLNSQSDFTDLAPDLKKDLLQHLRRTGIRFRRDREAALLALAIYYNQNRN